MFSSPVPPGNGDDGEGGDGATEGGDDGGSHPWGAGGPGGNPSKGDGGGNGWQSSSSLSWLTNLRKGIMSGGTVHDSGGDGRFRGCCAVCGHR